MKASLTQNVDSPDSEVSMKALLPQNVDSCDSIVSMKAPHPQNFYESTSPSKGGEPWPWFNKNVAAKGKEERKGKRTERSK